MALNDGAPSAESHSVLMSVYAALIDGGWKSAVAVLSKKLWSVVVPMVEVAAIASLLYVIYALLRQEEVKRHSVLLDGRVGPNREKPRDIMKDHFFQNKQGLWIHHGLWWHESLGKPKGLVLHLHGHSEHSKRFVHVGEYLNKDGFAVFHLDHQGFGRSEGDRGHVEKFEHYVDDVMDYMQEVMYEGHPDWQDVPRFISAHSMGGLIAIHSALRCQTSSQPGHKLSGVMLSAPAINVDPSRNTWYLRLGAAILDVIIPKAPIIGFPLYPSTSFLQVKMFSSYDPLNYHGKVRLHQGLELLRGTVLALEYAQTFEQPILVFHGQEDLHCHINGSREFISKISSTDKTLHELPGLRHEPLQEEREEREKALKLWADWASKRLGKTPSRTECGANKESESYVKL